MHGAQRSQFAIMTMQMMWNCVPATISIIKKKQQHPPETKTRAAPLLRLPAFLVLVRQRLPLLRM
jgi:hypothetical protein